MNPADKFCETCHWWLEPDEGTGQCCRHAPTNVMCQVELDCDPKIADHAVWPVTHSCDRCGDWVESTWPEDEE